MNQEPTPEAPSEGWGYVAFAAAWLVPGLGHILLGHRRRGGVILLGIHGLFIAGLFIGGLKVLNPADQPIWGYGQFLAGWPMLVGYLLQHIYPDAPASYAKIQDIGTVYCGIAGMLNLLVILDVAVRASDSQEEAQHV